MKNKLKEEIFISLLREDENRLVHQMLHDFSTWDSFSLALRKQINLIGIFIQTWLKADEAIHFFSNKIVNKVDWIDIINATNTTPEFRCTDRCLPVIEKLNICEINANDDLFLFCKEVFEKQDYKFLLIPFSNHNIPFGSYIMTFSGNLPGENILEKLKGSLNVIQARLKDLFYNHFPITSYTYLPSFQTSKSIETAILFCDLRDSTSMFEIARMTVDEKYTKIIILLIKSLLEFASKIITVSNVGRIHRFIGDGFMATFGEYLNLGSVEKAKVACALSLSSAMLLKTGYDRLWKVLKEKILDVEFIGKYNEDIEMRLGIGLNYGKVWFDTFGLNIEKTGKGEVPRGFSEYTAIGDHLSLTQRLCSLASQPLSQLDYSFRSEKLPQVRLSSPIIGSRTFTYWIQNCFNKNKIDPLEDLRIDLLLKGKSYSTPSFELYPESINFESVIECLKGGHNDRFYNSLNVEYKTNKEINQIANEFAKKLDEL